MGLWLRLLEGSFECELLLSTHFLFAMWESVRLVVTVSVLGMYQMKKNCVSVDRK